MNHMAGRKKHSLEHVVRKTLTAAEPRPRDLAEILAPKSSPRSTGYVRTGPITVGPK